jgi:molybdopterin molybdotransferase
MPASRIAAIALTFRGCSRSYVPKYRAFTAADYRDPVVPDPISRLDALQRVLEHVRRLPLEDVETSAALGRVLGEPAASTVDLPPFASSAMDGYAVRAADTPGRLEVVGESVAGRPWPGSLGEGEAVAISTGAVVPAGASVAPVEVVKRDEAAVDVPEVAEGAHVRGVGGDARAGAVVVPAGTRLGAQQLAALAAAGVTRVRCARTPSAAVLATGSELRRPGQTLGAGEIYESNTALLAAQLRDATVLTRVADEQDATEAAIAAGLEHDVLITTGGVSMGEHDLVRPALQRLGVHEVFWRVAIRPGKPVSFGVRGETLVFGLPGNPVSTLVGFELFVRPALAALQGAEAGPRFLVGRLGADRRRSSERDELTRALLRVEGDDVVLEPLSGQESHMIVRAAQADALVLIERGDGTVAAGDPVRYLPL